MSGQADLTHEDVKRILQIVDEAGDMEVVVEYGGLKLRMQKGAPGQGTAPASLPAPQAESQAAAAPISLSTPAPQEPVPAAATEPASEPAPADDEGALAEGATAIRAPMLGRFFRASSPTELPYVEVGSKVKPDDTVGLIEVMKLFNNVKAGVAGTVVEIRVENEEMVEDDQVLFIVEPD